MKLLSSEVIKKYDYKQTRIKVNEFMEAFEENYFRYISVLPPSITSHLSDIKVQTSGFTSSPVERYVLKKIEREEDFLEYLNVILSVLDNLTMEEQHFFKGTFFMGNTELVMEEQLQCADKTLKHIKKSCIIKFALALNMAIIKVDI